MITHALARSAELAPPDVSRLRLIYLAWIVSTPTAGMDVVID